DRVGAVLDARADGPKGPGVDGALAERRQQRVSQDLDLPAPDLPDLGEPGAIVWRRHGTGHRLERGATAQDARVEPQLRRHRVSRQRYSSRSAASWRGGRAFAPFTRR